MGLDFHAINEAFARRFGFGATARMRVYQKLATHVENGVGVRDAVANMAESRLRLAGANDPSRLALLDWYRKMGQGRSFGEATRGWATPTETMLLSASDDAGQLTEGLRDAVLILEGKARMTRSVVAGLAYPVIVAIVAIIVAYGYSAYLFPRLSQQVDLNILTGIPAALNAFTTFVQDWMWLVVSVMVGGASYILYRLPRSDGALRIKLDRKFPPWTIYRITQSAAVLTSLAALIRSGVRIDDALSHLTHGQGRWLRNRVDAALRGMRGGVDIGEAFYRAGHGFPDDELIDDLMVYAQYPGFEDRLADIATQWREQAITQVQVLTKSVGTVLIMALGFVVLFMLGGTMQFVEVLTGQIGG